MSDSQYALMGHRRMVESDLQGGLITYANSDFDCTVGTFSIQQVLSPEGGGFTPMLLGDITVAREDFPEGTVFRTGQAVIARPNSGPVRNCKIYSIDDSGPLIKLTLRDQNQGA